MDASRIFSRLPIKGPVTNNTLDGAQYLVKLDADGLLDTTYFPTTLDITGVSGDFTIGGNLIVSGATTTISSETLTINDNVIVLNNNVSSGIPTENGGIQVRRGGSTSASILWDETTDTWKVGLAGSEVAISLSTDLSTHAADQTIHLTSSQNTWIDAITASSTEINHLVGVTSAVQTQLDGKQPIDTDLTAVAAISTTGYLRRTGTATWSTQTASQIKTEMSLNLVENTALSSWTGTATLRNGIQVPNVYSTSSGYLSLNTTQVRNNWIVEENGSAESVTFNALADTAGDRFGNCFVLYNGSNSHIYWLKGFNGAYLGAVSSGTMSGMTGSIVGDYVFNTDAGSYYVWNGGGWSQNNNPPYTGNYLGAFDSVGMNASSPASGDYCYNTDQSSYYSYDGAMWNNAGVTANTCGYTTLVAVNINYNDTAENIAASIYGGLTPIFTNVGVNNSELSYTTTAVGAMSDPLVLTSGYTFTVTVQGDPDTTHYLVIDESALSSSASFVNLTGLLHDTDIGSTVQGFVSASSTGAGSLVRSDGPTLTGAVVLPSTTTIGLVSSTELGYLDGVTSSIQTQFGLKANLASPTFTGTVVLPSTTSIGTVSSTELGYLDGVTSSIQTQLTARALAGTNTDINSLNPTGHTLIVGSDSLVDNKYLKVTSGSLAAVQLAHSAAGSPMIELECYLSEGYLGYRNLLTVRNRNTGNVLFTGNSTGETCTFTANAILNGTNNTAPGQTTAASASSLMTRELVFNEDFLRTGITISSVNGNNIFNATNGSSGQFHNVHYIFLTPDLAGGSSGMTLTYYFGGAIGSGGALPLGYPFWMSLDFQTNGIVGGCEYRWLIGVEYTHYALAGRGVAAVITGTNTVQLQIHDGSVLHTKDCTVSGIGNGGMTRLILRWDGVDTLSLYAAHGSGYAPAARATFVDSFTQAPGGGFQYTAVRLVVAHTSTAKTITSSAVSNPGQITATAHGFVTGDRVLIAGHTGSTPDINNAYTITVIDANTFSITANGSPPGNDTNITVGGTGGTATKVPPYGPSFLFQQLKYAMV